MYPNNSENINFDCQMEDIYSAWAACSLGIANAAFKKLYSVLGSAENIYRLSDYSSFGLTENQRKKLSDKDLKKASSCIHSALSKGFIPLAYGNEHYPKKLKQISTPPSIIYCKGNIPDFDKYYCIGIVGTRKPSRDALEETYKIASRLSKKGVIIISGIALGIDAQAHSAALVENGFTVGISGVKAGQCYPKNNTFLYEKMYEKGLVVSEHSPADTVENGSFPKRNRIISALSDALIMVEAPEKSGALITAQKSLSMKQAVFVPSWNRPSNEGGRALLEKNAKKLKNEDDIFDFFNEVEGKEYFPNETPVFLLKSPKENKKSFFENNYSKKTSDKQDIFSETEHNIFSDTSSQKNVSMEEKTFSNNNSESKNISVPDELTETEKNVFLYIMNNHSPSTDKILSDLGFSHPETISAISMLEIYGYVKKLPGDKWSIL